MFRYLERGAVVFVFISNSRSCFGVFVYPQLFQKHLQLFSNLSMAIIHPRLQKPDSTELINPSEQASSFDVPLCQTLLLGRCLTSRLL